VAAALASRSEVATASASESRNASVAQSEARAAPRPARQPVSLSTHVDSWAESGPLMENLALRGSLPDEANGTALVEER
jgi:hypothetical protein